LEIDGIEQQLGMQRNSSMITILGMPADYWDLSRSDLRCRPQQIQTKTHLEPSTPFSTRTAQDVFNQVYKRLCLPKGFTFQSLRNSYSTHLVENGIDVRFVQHLLGHNDVRTTLQHTHVSQKKINHIESPLDRELRLKNEKENEK
jgi:site-specific recombinase XerD